MTGSNIRRHMLCGISLTPTPKSMLALLKLEKKEWKEHHEISMGIYLALAFPKSKKKFEKLDQGFFSLGQDEEYYENVKNIDLDILESLNDVVKDSALLNEVMHEDVFIKSLSREVSIMKISNQLRRIVGGGERIEKYQIDFYYNHAIENNGATVSMTVDPNSLLPSNMHIIIGRNGVGKTTFLKNLASSLFARTSPLGRAEITTGQIEGVVCVSFSAFDDLLNEIMNVYGLENGRENLYTFKYISNKLKIEKCNEKNEWTWRYKDNDELVLDFLAAYLKCYGKNNWAIWNEARSILSQDPIFKTIELRHPQEPQKNQSDDKFSGLWLSAMDQMYQIGLDIENEVKNFDKKGERERNSSSLISKLQERYPFFLRESRTAEYQDEMGFFLGNLVDLFRKLSSGHTAVLMMVTQLIDILSERTIVLFDEPETHLHPPLISNLIKVISKILKERNSLAIVSTHSPVVLQEVPRSNVHILERTRDVTRVSKPTIETFGENVGRLTAEVFRLELINSGYYATLKELVNEIFKEYPHLSQDDLFDEAMKKVEGQVGFEGKMIISSLASQVLEEGDLYSYDE